MLNWDIMPSVEPFFNRPENPSGDGVVLTHGAGGDCNGRLLVAVADTLSQAGFLVLRFDLPFRRDRHAPHPSRAGLDRDALREAAGIMRGMISGRVVLGGHSYGGRQSSMLAAEDPEVADALLLFSYPLHPPRTPDKLRTGHLPGIRNPTLFVHGTKDPFGSIQEMQVASRLLNSPVVLSEVTGAAHDLAGGKFDIAKLVLRPLSGLLAH